MDKNVNALTALNDTLYAGGVFTTAGGQASAYWARWGPVCPPGDFNKDGNVDHDDFILFDDCWSGPAVPLTSGCEPMDFDMDNDVDQVDFGVFQRCYGG